jgi:hypothetical protein
MWDGVGTGSELFSMEMCDQAVMSLAGHPEGKGKLVLPYST